MSDALDYTMFGEGVTAFTTLRTLGRDRTGLCQLLGIDDEHLVIPHQTHEDRVLVVNEGFIRLPWYDKKEILEGVDAVMTDVPGVCIGVSTADCIPVLLYDTEHEAVAVVHAGWRGTVKRIVQKAIMTMTRAYASRPEMLKAVVGPGISMKNFEVGDEVYDLFAKAGFEMEDIARKYPVTGNPASEKWHLDIVECNRRQMIEGGVLSKNIHVEAICTYDDCNFFSARREQKGSVKCGRNFNAIMITPNRTTGLE